MRAFGQQESAHESRAAIYFSNTSAATVARPFVGVHLFDWVPVDPRLYSRRPFDWKFACWEPAAYRGLAVNVSNYDESGLKFTKLLYLILPPVFVSSAYSRVIFLDSGPLE